MGSWTVWAGLATVVHALLVFGFQRGWGGGPLPGCNGFFCDFERYYLPTFRDLGATPGAGYLYPPFFAFLFQPVGWLAAGAHAGWAAVQLAAVFLLARAPIGPIEKAYGRRGGLVYIALVALSAALVDSTVLGQVSPLLTGLVLGALALDRSGRTPAGAAVLGAAIAIKYYPALFLAWWLFRREWRFVGWCAGWTAAFTLLPAVVLGPAATADFIGRSLAQLGANVSEAQTSLLSQNWLLALGRLGAYFPAVFPFTPWALVCVVLLAGAAWGFLGAIRERRPLIAFALLFPTIPFLIGITWPHYLVYLPFCQVVALGEARSAPVGKGVLVALVGVSIFAGTVVAMALVDPGVYPAVALPFLANLLVLAALVVLQAIRATRPPG